MDNEVGAATAASVIPTKGLQVKPEHKAEWVRRFRESGMSYTQFSRQHGIRRASLCNWVNRQSPPAAEGCVRFTELKVPSPLLECASWSAELTLANGNVLRLCGSVPPEILERLLRVC